jgi:hypothetical protein
MADETKFKYAPMFLVFCIFIGFVVYLLISRNGHVIKDTVVGVNTCENCTVVKPSSALTGGAGRKRAVLYGCNYNFPGSVCVEKNCILYGCIDDVNNVKEYLITTGFQQENIQVYVDDGSTSTPTKDLIISTLTNLIESTQENDVAFVWYSGHGAQLANSLAVDGLSECWCPPDTIASGNYLTDITLNNIVKKAKKNARVFIGSDSCHSATVMDLPYFLSPPTFVGRDIKAKLSSFASRAVITEQMKLRARSIVRNVRSTMNVICDSTYSPTEGNVLCLSGCQDWDTSADAYEAGEAQGAMTWAFLTAASATTTLSDLLTAMRSILSSNYFSQVPQLSSGVLFDPNTTTLEAFLS